jgi:arylsulfatase A-like enzyme
VSRQGPARGGERRPPNIVLCLCDQMRAFELGCYGHPVVRTPNIDRLASEGALFEIACSNAPLCVPARSCLLSGQYARTCAGTTTNFCGFPPSRLRTVCPDPLLPEVLRDAGYATGLVGKWHLHPAPDVCGLQEGTIPHNHHQHYRQSFYDLTGGDRRIVDGFSLDYEISQVREFVHAHRAEPFFLEYSLSPPHSPLADAPRRYLEMYSRDDALLRDNVRVDGVEAYDREWFYRYCFDYLGVLMILAEEDDWLMDDRQHVRETQSLPHAVTRLIDHLSRLMNDDRIGATLRERLRYVDDRWLEGFDLRDLTALYYGMVTCVDDYVGRLMETLRDEGVADDTLLIFTSDHGDNLGSHHLWNKGHIFDESIRIPLVMHAPDRIPAGRIDDRVASLIDVMPTVLGHIGVPVPTSVQGTDLSALLSGHAEDSAGSLAFIEGKFPQIGVRTATHLFGTEMLGDDEASREPAESSDGHYFFDLGTDPFQMSNLATGGGDATLQAHLRDLLWDWHRTTPRRPSTRS